jgi:predicted porin
LEKLAMKKSLIAVAALAAVGAASAQSSVTLYGVLDTGFGVTQTKQTVPGFATRKVRTTGLYSGGLSGSRWGLKGQEDLGNGLSAVFNVEAGFNSVNGDFTDGFNRRSVVGLKGSFGQVLLGRDYTPMDTIGGGDYFQASDLVTGDDEFGGLYTARANGIHYSGEFGGVGVKAFVGYDDQKTTVSGIGTTSRNRNEGYGVGVSYAGGPFMVGAAVQQFRAKDAVATYSKNTEYGLGASYDFTAAKLYTHYIANDFQTPNEKPLQQFGLGVTVPFGAFTLGGQYAYNYYKAGTNSKAKGHDFVLQGTYALSKRTDVYARAARVDSWKQKTSGHTVMKTNTDSFAVGVRHRF